MKWFHDGILSDEVIGMHVTDVYPELDNQTSSIMRVIESGKPRFDERQIIHTCRRELYDSIRNARCAGMQVCRRRSPETGVKHLRTGAETLPPERCTRKWPERYFLFLSGPLRWFFLPSLFTAFFPISYSFFAPSMPGLCITVSSFPHLFFNSGKLLSSSQSPSQWPSQFP